MLVELPALGARELKPVLEEEAARWLALLHWDFTPLAELILRYAGMGTLEGFALRAGDAVIGYAYYVAEGSKGLIGDFYVRGAWRSAVNEGMLLGAVVDRLRRMPWLERIEAQLLHLGSSVRQVAAEMAPACYPRQFMVARLGREGVQGERERGWVRLERWSGYWMEAAAELIASAYSGHVDSEINTQYRTAAGARRFLENLLRYPGCGHFAPDCSWVAVVGHEAAGVCLATRIGPGAGHVAQICVSPIWQGRGVGEALLRQALGAMKESGLEEASLTVTSSNTRAIRLYEKYGFRAVHHFEALVWELVAGAALSDRTGTKGSPAW